MSFWTAIVIIVAIGAITSVLQARYRAQHGITTDAMGNETSLPRDEANAEKKALQGEVEELRERVRVLERIAYDERKRLGLADEIEQLRNEP